MKSNTKVPWTVVKACRLKAGSRRTISYLICVACTECRASRKSVSDASAQESGRNLRALTSRETELCSLLGLRRLTARWGHVMLIAPRTLCTFLMLSGARLGGV